MKTVPFNYDLIAQGYKPVTTDGREVKQLTRFEVKTSYYPLQGVVEGVPERWKMEGYYANQKTAHYMDLVLEVPAEKTKRMCVTFYDDDQISIHATHLDTDNQPDNVVVLDVTRQGVNYTGQVIPKPGQKLSFPLFDQSKHVLSLYSHVQSRIDWETIEGKLLQSAISLMTAGLNVNFDTILTDVFLHARAAFPEIERMNAREWQGNKFEGNEVRDGEGRLLSVDFNNSQPYEGKVEIKQTFQQGGVKDGNGGEHFITNPTATGEVKKTEEEYYKKGMRDFLKNMDWDSLEGRELVEIISFFPDLSKLIAREKGGDADWVLICHYMHKFFRFKRKPHPATKWVGDTDGGDTAALAHEFARLWEIGREVEQEAVKKFTQEPDPETEGVRLPKSPGNQCGRISPVEYFHDRIASRIARITLNRRESLNEPLSRLQIDEILIDAKEETFAAYPGSENNLPPEDEGMPVSKINVPLAKSSFIDMLIKTLDLNR